MTPRRLIEPARLAGSSLLRTQTDARLVDLVRAGHASAFEAIVQRYRRPLLAYCSRLLPPARAEDAVQQAFLNAYQAMVRDDSELNLRPWLYRIAHNSSLNLLRQNGWTHEQLDESFDGVERPDQALERREELRSTLDALKALPERQRDAVVLRELEGLRYDEIALALGVGDGAVRQLLHRARATLRAGMSALTPVGLVERLAAVAQSSDPTARIAELAGGVGGGVGMAKLGAALLATGALATGAATVPATHHHRSDPARAEAADASVSAPALQSHVEVRTVLPLAKAPARKRGSGSADPRRSHRHRGSGRSGGNLLAAGGHHGGDSPNSGPGSLSHDRSGSGDHSGSGSGDRSGSDGHLRSGSGDGSGDHSGSGDGSTGSGDSGSHDGGGVTTTAPVVTPPPPDGSGDGGGGGGTSGPGGSSSSGDH